jgi:ubiquinone biosynthesis accessory factor UbiK
MNASLIEDLSAQLSLRLKALLASPPAQDLDKTVKALVTGVFARMELVTREEFDIQRAVLERTRTQLATLEARVAELERQRGE